MKITEIEVIPVRVDLPRTFAGSAYRMSERVTLITKVHTDEGLVGVTYNGDEARTQNEIAAIITDELGPLVTGHDALAVTDCWRRMLPLTFDILRDRQLVLMGMAAIDCALWDLVGKVAGLPLSRVWGAATDELPIVAIGGYYGQSPAELGQEVEDLLALGLGGCKMKVGGTSPAEDAERFRAMRAAGGDDFVLMADANQGYELWEAVEFVRRVGADQLRWFEEPCRWDVDRLWMRDVRAAAGVPVAAGQSEASAAGVRDLLAGGAIDVCNLDASWSGGATEWRRAAGLCATYGVTMAHHEEAHLSAQLLASVPDAAYVEVFHPDRDPIWWGMLANRPEPKEGRIGVPQDPGWGFELDWSWVDAHRDDR